MFWSLILMFKPPIQSSFQLCILTGFVSWMVGWLSQRGCIGCCAAPRQYSTGDQSGSCSQFWKIVFSLEPQPTKTHLHSWTSSLNSCSCWGQVSYEAQLPCQREVRTYRCYHLPRSHVNFLWRMFLVRKLINIWCTNPLSCHWDVEWALVKPRWGCNHHLAVISNYISWKLPHFWSIVSGRRVPIFISHSVCGQQWHCLQIYIAQLVLLFQEPLNWTQI